MKRTSRTPAARLWTLERTSAGSSIGCARSPTGLPSAARRRRGPARLLHGGRLRVPAVPRSDPAFADPVQLGVPPPAGNGASENLDPPHLPAGQRRADPIVPIPE